MAREECGDVVAISRDVNTDELSDLVSEFIGNRGRRVSRSQSYSTSD